MRKAVIDYEFMSGWVDWLRWIAELPSGYLAAFAVSLLGRAIAFVIPQNLTGVTVAVGLLLGGAECAALILSGVAAAPRAKRTTAWALTGVLFLQLAGLLALAQSWGFMTTALWRLSLFTAIGDLIGVGVALGTVYRARSPRARTFPLA